MKINDIFDYACYINLDRRGDRRSEMEGELSRVGIRAERVIAVDGKDITPGPGVKINRMEMGCLLSHRAVLSKMIKSGHSSALVLEDDVQFLGDPHVQVYNVFKNLPSDWDILYLGGNHVRPLVKSGSIWKCVRTFTTSSYAISAQFAEKIMDRLDGHKQVDVVYADSHHRGKSFAVSPGCAVQRAGFSDIQNSKVNYRHLIK